MHEPVINRLEEYLDGGGPFADVELHLQKCAECRDELGAMRRQTALLQSLRAPQDLELPPVFYANVMHRIESQAKPSIWSLFGESLFAKRLGYASATALLLLGTVLISSTQSEEAELANSSPVDILAGEYQPVPVDMDDTEQGRDVVLVNLATYQDLDLP